MKMSFIKLVATAVAILAVQGCASHSVTEPQVYNHDRSKAWNIANSVGMHEIEDVEVPEEVKKDSKILAVAEFAINSSLWTSDHGFGLDWSQGLGLGFIQSMGKTYDQGEQSTLIAWIPEAKSPSKEEGVQWVIESINQAAITALKEKGLQGTPKVTVEKKPRLMGGPFYRGSVEGVVDGGSTCFTEYVIYENEYSEKPEKIPSHISEIGGTGYKINAGGIENPEYYSACIDDDGKESMSFSAEVTKNFPETLYAYRTAKKYEEVFLPQRIMDHGKVLLFIKP